MNFRRNTSISEAPASARRGAIWAILALSINLLGFGYSGLARAQEPGFEGQRVAQIRILYPSGSVVSEKIPPLALKVGQPFDFVAERASLRTLYSLGDYSDIRVAALMASDGAEVNFIVTPNLYNNIITIAGLHPPPTQAAALAALRLNLGDPFRESALREAVGRLRSALSDDGFYEAKVSWTIEPHPETRQMDVTVTISSGPRAHVGAVNLVNKTPYSDQELLRRLKISGKTAVEAASFSRSNERLKKFLVNQGYLGAGGVITRGDYDAKSATVPLTIAVTAGPRVRVEIQGAHLTRSQQRRLIPIFEEGAVDEDLLQEGRRNIRDFMQSQGYFDADVAVHSEQTNQQGERVITFDIMRGDHFRLAGVAFDGNKYFRTGLLARRLQLQPASFASRGRFSQQMLRNDIDSLRALYIANGFRDVQVTSSVDDHYRDKKDNLFVTLHVVEGDQTHVASLQIQGNAAISTADLLKVTGSTVGQPYSDFAVASDRNNVLAVYYNDGYPDAQFNQQVSPGEAPNTVRIVYQIAEGNRVEVSNVLLSGYLFTRRGIVARQVDIQPDGPLREGDVAKTQRQLYNLGVFDRVQIAPQNPAGTDPDKAVVVAVHEGDRITLGYGFGFEVQRVAGGTNPSGTEVSASPRVIFEIARANMFGRAQTFSFKARASTLEYRADLAYRADNFLANRNFSLQLTGYADKSQDINTFSSTRFEGGLQVVQKLSPSSSFLYRYFYRRVEAYNLAKTISPEEIPLLSQPTLVSGFGVTYARDRRDDPADPKNGTFNTVDVSDAIRAIGSGAGFFRAFFQNSSFHSFGRAFVFARSVRFGFEQPLGSTVEGSTVFNPEQCTQTMAPPDTFPEIPLPERFFAGGGTTLRGFGLNQAGPRDPCTGFPIGGLALLVFNQELRFPMRLPWVGNRLGGTIFYDGGNVYTDVNHITLKWKTHSLTDLNYFSHTVGFGLRYPTPVGPVRVDFGFQLNPAYYQIFDTTTSQIQPHELPHFGFSFNIGPVF